MLTAKEKSLLSALEPRAASEGVEIVTLEVVGSKKAPTIRVYIDTEGGVSFDELARGPGVDRRTSWTSWTRSPAPTCWRCPLRASTGRCARSEHFRAALPARR